MTSQDADGYEHRQVAAARQARNEERILGDKHGDDANTDAATVGTGNTYTSILHSEIGEEENSYSQILSAAAAAAIGDSKLPLDSCNYYDVADNASSLHEDRFNNNNNSNNQTDRQDRGQQQELAASSASAAAAAQQCGVYDCVPDDETNLYDVIGDGENESAYADIDDMVTAVNRGQGHVMEAYEEIKEVAAQAIRRSDRPRATGGGEGGVADACPTYHVRGSLSVASSVADRNYQLEDDLLRDYDHISSTKISRITKRTLVIVLLAGGVVLAVACILVALLIDVKSVLTGKQLSVTTTTTLPSLPANAAAVIPDNSASAIRTRWTTTTPKPWVVETTLTVMTTGAGVVFADGRKVADLPAMVLKSIVLNGEIKVVAITVTTGMKPKNRAGVRASADRPFAHNTKRLCTGFTQDWRCLDKAPSVDWYTSTYSMHSAWPISSVMNAKDLDYFGQSRNDKQCPFISSQSGGAVNPNNARSTIYCRWVRSR